MPLLSFFQSFDNAAGGQELSPFLNGHVYLLPGAGTFDLNQPGMAFDLKWSSNDIDRRMVKAFLAQLCLQTAAELVVDGGTRAGWAFSYPTAFSDEQMEGFPEIWNQVTTEMRGFDWTVSDSSERETDRKCFSGALFRESSQRRDRHGNHLCRHWRQHFGHFSVARR
jgi:hypothetical protein